MIKLFISLLNGTLFHFGDNPDRKLIKDDGSHYVGPTGRHNIHPHVAVIPDASKDQWHNSFFNREGKSNEKQSD